MTRRARRRLLTWVLGWLLGCVAPWANAGDPYLRWQTLKTPHFHIHYHGGLEEMAERTANLAEFAYGELVPDLGWAPSELTEIVITDDTDGANGSASVLPYNMVHMFAVAPDDMSPLGDYDDWVSELVTHELTHVVHIDNIGGLPAILNVILGKTFSPNQFQPRWILEGLAIVMESEYTSAGRLRSTQFDMMLRADVLENRLASLDEMSNPGRRWPGGNLWYLYGSKFIEWIVRTYGPDTYAAVARDYGRTALPWAINRSIRRATGLTYEELYQGFSDHLSRRYRAQTARIRERGLRQGQRLTHHGRLAQTPRFVPARCADRPGLLFYARDDSHTSGGLYALSVFDWAPEARAELVIRTDGRGFAFGQDCSTVFQNSAPSERRHFLTDLFLQPSHTRSPRGIEQSRRRLTSGARARDPDVSPNGRQLVFVTTSGGTSTLRIANLTSDSRIEQVRTLVPSARFEQAYTPRFSPDGRYVAYSAWTAGGYRDIRLVEVETGAFRELWRDRAIDQQPTWSPDGTTLYFTSDRSGVANIYGYDLASGGLYQVTNVLTGAYMPEVSSDGRRLAYVGYTSAGFDLYVMPLERSSWLSPESDGRVPRAPAREHSSRHWPASEYNPLPSLRPRAWSVNVGAGTFGTLFNLSTRGGDAVGLHSFAARLSLQTQLPEPQVGIDYGYGRLPMLFQASLFRAVAPRRGFRFGDRVPLIKEYLTGFTSGIVLPLPGEFEQQSVGLSYTALRFQQDLPIGTRGDPHSLLTLEPDRGFLGVLHLGYGYSNVESSMHMAGITGERGWSLGISADIADPRLASESSVTLVTGYFTGYLPLPWGRHHVLALALSGGASAGTYARRGLFSTGGFLEVPLSDPFETFRSGLQQSAFVLRGYHPGQFIGQEFSLLNLEYRFPLAFIDRGISTLPAFLRTLSGAVFADYGGAYDRVDPRDPLGQHHMALGAEFWVDFVLAYAVRANLRMGAAQGLDSKAPGLQSYAVFASAF